MADEAGPNGTFNDLMSSSEEIPMIPSGNVCESITVGVIYIITSLVLLSISLSFNAVLLTDREFRSLQAHRLMVLMGLLDCVQLLGHLFSGFATIWETVIYAMPHFCRILSAISNSAWSALFPLSLLIAFQRFLIVRNSVNSKDKFSTAMKVSISLCLTYWLAFCMGLLFVGEIVYTPDNFSWTYGTDNGSLLLENFEFVFSVACIVLTFITYIAIAISLYQQSRGIKMMRQNERLLLIQASILFLILTSLISLWHFYYMVLPDTVWTLFAVNLSWILYCGFNPILYLIFSKFEHTRCVPTIHPNTSTDKTNNSSLVSYKWISLLNYMVILRTVAVFSTVSRSQSCHDNDNIVNKEAKHY